MTHTLSYGNDRWTCDCGAAFPQQTTAEIVAHVGADDAVVVVFPEHERHARTSVAWIVWAFHCNNHSVSLSLRHELISTVALARVYARTVQQGSTA